MILVENLNAKEKMSSLQLGIAVTAGLLTTRLIFTTPLLLSNAAQFSWLSSVLAGFIFYFAAYLMIRLGEQFSEETLGEYLPRLMGKTFGALAFSIFIIILILNITSCAISVTTLYVTFMFDQTPRAALVIVLLLAVVYCTLKSWGTILKVIQIFIIALPLLYLFHSLIWLNFDLINLLPLWPDNFIGILKPVPYHTEYYAGYEALLVLLPLTNRGKISFARIVGWGFIVITFMYVLGAIVLVGNITAQTGASVPAPVIYAMKSVELPETFLERLENYMISLLLPVTYMSMVTSYFAVAEGCRKYFNCKDHRIFIPVFLPLIFFLSTLIDSPERAEALRNINMFIALFFSFIIVPLLLFLACRKKGSNQ